MKFANKGTIWSICAGMRPDIFTSPVIAFTKTNMYTLLIPIDDTDYTYLKNQP